MKKNILFVSIISLTFTLAAADNVLEIKIINAPIQVEEFAGKLVQYKAVCKYEGDENAQGWLNSETTSALSHEGCYFGFILPQPIYGEDFFYRLIPLLKPYGNIFIRDFGLIFLEACTVQMRALDSEEIQVMKKVLEKKNIDFRGKEFFKEIDSNPEPLLQQLFSSSQAVAFSDDEHSAKKKRLE